MAAHSDKRDIRVNPQDSKAMSVEKEKKRSDSMFRMLESGDFGEFDGQLFVALDLDKRVVIDGDMSRIKLAERVAPNDPEWPFGKLRIAGPFSSKQKPENKIRYNKESLRPLSDRPAVAAMQTS